MIKKITYKTINVKIFRKKKICNKKIYSQKFFFFKLPRKNLFRKIFKNSCMTYKILGNFFFLKLRDVIFKKLEKNVWLKKELFDENFSKWIFKEILKKDCKSV